MFWGNVPTTTDYDADISAASSLSACYLLFSNLVIGYPIPATATIPVRTLCDLRARCSAGLRAVLNT